MRPNMTCRIHSRHSATSVLGAQHKAGMLSECMCACCVLLTCVTGGGGGTALITSKSYTSVIPSVVNLECLSVCVNLPVFRLLSLVRKYYSSQTFWNHS